MTNKIIYDYPNFRMAFLEGEQPSVDSILISIREQMLDLLDPQRANPELDFQINRLVHCGTPKTSEDRAEIARNQATIGRLQKALNRR